MMRKMSTNPAEYVVFDIETNGLRSQVDDLLSISFYKPDDGKEYNKFLPLELQKEIRTTYINGITTETLNGATPLTQAEFDNIVKEFELEKRTILIYAGRDFDKLFLVEYMKRHKISGFENLNFYNIKKNILSSKRSRRNVTKDNLCALFGIEGIESIHNGLNDCKLEWKLFEKMEGNVYLVIAEDEILTTPQRYFTRCNDKVFRIPEGYVIPIDLLYTYPRLSRILDDRPYIECQSKFVRSFEIDAKGMAHAQIAYIRITIEHMMKSMLNAEAQDSQLFLANNHQKLELVGELPVPGGAWFLDPTTVNPDGTISKLKDETWKDVNEKRILNAADDLEERMSPLIDFIRCKIFKNDPIMYRELVINHKNNIFSVCHFSSKKAILEISTGDVDSQTYKERFFYGAKERDVYHLKMKWVRNDAELSIEKIIFEIVSVDVHEETPGLPNWFEGKREEKNSQKAAEIKKYLSPLNLSLTYFEKIGSPIKVQCKVCNYEWSTKYKELMKSTPKCPKCNPEVISKRQPTKRKKQK